MRYIRDNGSFAYDDALDFANMVFSMEYSGIDFYDSFPKAYREDRKAILSRYAFMDDEKDRIRALIDTYPVTMALMAADGISLVLLKTSYVGGVAVHPNYREKGLFSSLMENMIHDEIEDETDLLIVDGERARYGHFGFEKAGTKYTFSIDYKSAMYEADGNDTLGFEWIGDEDEDGDEIIDLFYKLYCENRNVMARTRDDFFVTLTSMGAEVYAVKDGGEIVGYISLDEKEKKINEFVLANLAKIPELMQGIIESFGMDKLTVTVGSDEIEKIKYLERISEYYNTSCSHQIRILNYESVLRFMLEWKRKYTVIENGEYTFGIYDQGMVKSYKITVNDGDIKVRQVDDMPEETFTEKEFVKVMTTGYYHVQHENSHKLPAGWFPLPFFLPEADTF